MRSTTQSSTPEPDARLNMRIVDLPWRLWQRTDVRPQAPSGPSPSSPSGDPTASPDAVGKTARRGLLYISLAKLWFMVAGLLLQLLLPRAFGSAARFGVWTLVLAWVSTLNNVVITDSNRGIAFMNFDGGTVSVSRKNEEVE